MQAGTENKAEIGKDRQGQLRSNLDMLFLCFVQSARPRQLSLYNSRRMSGVTIAEQPLVSAEQPLVSIVTPCLNAGRFIERTIESVLAQDYPRIEYIIVDGGSTDETAAILARYRDRLQYVSEPDLGVADAVNRGFARSRGSIIAWLNADDIYFPGAVSAATRCFLSDEETAVVYGEGEWIDEHNLTLGRYPTVAPYDPTALERECRICQPTAFIRRDAFETVGGLNPDLRSAFDYDLWIRLSGKYRFVALSNCLAASRMHKGNITLRQRKLVFEESIGILRRHYGYVPVSWIYAQLSFRRDGRDQYFEPLRRSIGVYAHSLVVGSCYNFRHLWRYWRDWISYAAKPKPTRPGALEKVFDRP
jgi:glycosyltransferase involved in cell wall biosynthesis